MAFTFKGTYTKNRGDQVASGTVEIFSHRGVSLDSATLDENGSYELVLSAQEGEVKVVETLDGVEERSYPVSVSRGSTTDTSRDIGYVGPSAQSGASVPDFSEVTPGFALVVLQDPEPADATFTVSLAPASSADGGTWTLSYGGDTSAAIDWDDDDSVVAIGAMPSIGEDNIFMTTTGTINDGFGLHFQAALGGQPITGITADASSLTGPDAPYTIDVAVNQEGVVGGEKTLGWGQPWD